MSGTFSNKSVTKFWSKVLFRIARYAAAMDNGSEK